MSLRSLPEIKAFQKLDTLQSDLPEECVAVFDPAIIAANDNAATISIYGEIGYDWTYSVDNTERRISAALRSIGRKDVAVNLNSPGGSFFSGLAIYNLFRLHKAKVTINILGMAGSAASIIAMAGDEILMGDGSQIMVHNASAVVVGNRFDAQEAFEILSEIDDGMAEVYAARGKVDKKIAVSWMDRNRGNGTVFNSKKAIDLGLADGTLDGADIKMDARVARYVPEERVIEKSLIATGMSARDAKAYVAQFKSGTRDASSNVTRDADETLAALKQLQSTLRSQGEIQ